jgi:hypothetical protein
VDFRGLGCGRRALQDLDRNPQELGHYDDYHDRHPRNGSAPCLDDALLRAPFTPSTSRERARTLRRLPRPASTPQTDNTTTTTTGIHATDPLLVSTTPYYAHLSPLLLRARGALQDLDRTPQEPGHYDDYHDQAALSYAMCLYLIQLYSLQASATQLTGTYWAAPYASSLLPRSRARARCGLRAFAPAPAAHVLASR